MIEVVTVCGDEEIHWQVEMTVGQRKEIHRRECVFVAEIGGQQRLTIMTHPLLEVLEGAIRADESEGEFEAWFWGLPHAHIESLATQIGSYIYTGIEPKDQGLDEEGDEPPLVGPRPSSGPPTGGTHPAESSRDAGGPSPTATPESDGFNRTM